MTGVSRVLLGRPGGEKLIAPTVRLFLSAPRYSVHRWTLVRRPSPLAAVLRIGAIEERSATCETARWPFHRMGRPPDEEMSTPSRNVHRMRRLTSQLALL